MTEIVEEVMHAPPDTFSGTICYYFIGLEYGFFKTWTWRRPIKSLWRWKLYKRTTGYGFQTLTSEVFETFKEAQAVCDDRLGILRR